MFATQSWPTLCDSKDCSLHGSSVSLRQEYWNVLLFPSPRDLSDPNQNCLLHCRSGKGEFFTTEPPGKSKELENVLINF